MNTQAMGVKEFADAIAAGQMSPTDVLSVLDHRIAKRKQAGKNLVPGVVKYRNELADSLGNASMPMPVYANKSSATELPDDPDALAALVINKLGKNGISPFIQRLATALA